MRIASGPIVTNPVSDKDKAIDSDIPISLSPEDKLTALRRLDGFRKWNSLDDQRYCLACCKLIIGRQIKVLGGTRNHGPLRLSCPTENCSSIPMDWALPELGCEENDLSQRLTALEQRLA